MTSEKTPYGTIYVIEGSIKVLGNKEIEIRTVWIIETEVEEPRFVTAYPAK